MFDAGKLSGDLVVRFARPGETAAALNGREYELDPEMTAIADDTGVQSLGGVIGGEPTGCTETTTEVFVEAALFDPVRTAATGRRLDIVSDARYRFERGLDPAFVGPGLEIATRLILELCGGEPSEVVVAGAEPEWRRTLCAARRAARRLWAGCMSRRREPRHPRSALAAPSTSRRADGSSRSQPRLWRGDIEGEADLVEEVLAGQGLRPDPAGAAAARHGACRGRRSTAARRVELVRRTLAERGLTEAVTFSFIPSAQGRAVRRRQAGVAAGQPDQRRSRRDAAERVAGARRCGAAQRRSRLSRCRAVRARAALSRRPAGRPGECRRRACAPGGPAAHWREPAREADLYDAKADALAALAAPGAPADNIQATAEPPPWYHPGRAGMLRLGPTVLGHFGELHPDVLEAFE